MLIESIIPPVKAAEKGKWRFNSLLWQSKNVKKRKATVAWKMSLALKSRK